MCIRDRLWGFRYPIHHTMYDFHNSTDTLKFWTEKRSINKTFLFFTRFCWNLVKLWVLTHWVLQLQQVSSKLDEKTKSFINRPFFCSEFQNVNRIVKIVHSANSYARNEMDWTQIDKSISSFLPNFWCFFQSAAWREGKWRKFLFNLRSIHLLKKRHFPLVTEKPKKNWFVG